MGNGISEDKLSKSEAKILTYSDMALEEFELKKVIIDEKGNYVRTIEVGQVITFNFEFFFRNRSRN
jgi:hypothetical protein